MYNEELNKRFTDRFKESLQGKRILLVGNSASMFSSKEHGEIVDSYDFVLRFGKGWPDPADKAYLGTRTDAWFFGPSRAGMYKHFKDVKWKIYTPSQLKVYDKTDDVLIPRTMVNGKFQIYRDFFMAYDSDYVCTLNKKVNGSIANVARLSQGIQAIDWMINLLKIPEITLIGFDFFAAEFNYTFDNSRDPNIPKEHTGASWHCPLVSKNYDTNPHAMKEADSEETNEQRYIMNLPGVNLIKMPKIDHEKMDQMVKRIRGNNSSIVK